MTEDCENDQTGQIFTQHQRIFLNTSPDCT